MRLSRRSFFTTSACIVAAVSCPDLAQAQDTQIVTESDPAAAALGFHSDASTVDKKKFPQYETGQACHACAFFQGKAGAVDGPCSMYGGRRVPAKGWCSAFFKRV